MRSPISEITRQSHDRDSNQRCESCKSNVLTTTPPSHLQLQNCVISSSTNVLLATDCVLLSLITLHVTTSHQRYGSSTGLRVCQRVVFKITGLIHQSFIGATPMYLAHDCCLLSDIGRRPLRANSNYMLKLLVPRTHNKLADRSFSAAGPRLWNDLPLELRQLGPSFDSFRQSLKSHLFGD